MASSAPTNNRNVIGCVFMIEMRVVGVVGFEIELMMKAVADSRRGPKSYEDDDVALLELQYVL